jgi:hypothetical protein
LLVVGSRRTEPLHPSTKQSWKCMHKTPAAIPGLDLTCASTTLVTIYSASGGTSRHKTRI